MALTNIALVLQELTTKIGTEFSNMKFIHDNDLSYESAITKLRSKNEIEGNSDPAFPLFIFKRSVLRWVTEHRRLSRSLVPSLEDTVDIYKVAQGVFTVDFLLTSTDMSDIEDFEIRYLAEDGFSSVKKLIVTIPDLGDFTYNAHWNELSDLQIVNEGNMYAALSGSIEVHGWYFVMDENSPRIKMVKLKIETFLNEIFVSKTISM